MRVLSCQAKFLRISANLPFESAQGRLGQTGETVRALGVDPNNFCINKHQASCDLAGLPNFKSNRLWSQCSVTLPRYLHSFCHERLLSYPLAMLMLPLWQWRILHRDGVARCVTFAWRNGRGRGNRFCVSRSPLLSTPRALSRPLFYGGGRACASGLASRHADRSVDLPDDGGELAAFNACRGSAGASICSKAWLRGSREAPLPSRGLGSA